MSTWRGKHIAHVSKHIAHSQTNDGLAILVASNYVQGEANEKEAAACGERLRAVEKARFGVGEKGAEGVASEHRI